MRTVIAIFQTLPVVAINFNREGCSDPCCMYRDFQSTTYTRAMGIAKNVETIGGTGETRLVETAPGDG